MSGKDKGKLKRSTGIEGMDFGEALKRLVGVDPKELESDIADTKSKSEEIERDVRDTEDSIERGARTSRRRFRL